MRPSRCCSRNGCDQPPVATLTYVYADSTAVLGPLAAHPEPHTYDLCHAHAQSLTAPRGWELVRHEGDLASPAPVDDDDLLALAEALREPVADPRPERRRPSPFPRRSEGQRGHLRALPPPDRPG